MYCSLDVRPTLRRTTNTAPFVKPSLSQKRTLTHDESIEDNEDHLENLPLSKRQNSSAMNEDKAEEASGESMRPSVIDDEELDFL